MAWSRPTRSCGAHVDHGEAARGAVVDRHLGRRRAGSGRCRSERACRRFRAAPPRRELAVEHPEQIRPGRAPAGALQQAPERRAHVEDVQREPVRGGDDARAEDVDAVGGEHARRTARAGRAGPGPRGPARWSRRRGWWRRNAASGALRRAREQPRVERGALGIRGEEVALGEACAEPRPRAAPKARAQRSSKRSRDARRQPARGGSPCPSRCARAPCRTAP